MGCQPINVQLKSIIERHLESCCDVVSSLLLRSAWRHGFGYPILTCQSVDEILVLPFK